jgi:hypothetical protein
MKIAFKVSNKSGKIIVVDNYENYLCAENPSKIVLLLA